MYIRICVYMYVYTYMYVYKYIHISIYIRAASIYTYVGYIPYCLFVEYPAITRPSRW